MSNYFLMMLAFANFVWFFISVVLWCRHIICPIIYFLWRMKGWWHSFLRILFLSQHGNVFPIWAIIYFLEKCKLRPQLVLNLYICPMLTADCWITIWNIWIEQNILINSRLKHYFQEGRGDSRTQPVAF